MGGHRISPRSFCPERPVARVALLSRRHGEAGLKKSEEVMEILEAFDLAGSLRGAAELAGCDHKTVAHWVRARDAAGGGLPVAARRRPMVDGFAEKIDELVERSKGRIRADKAHETLVAMGYLGSERTTRRAVAEAKRVWRVRARAPHAAVAAGARAVDAVGLRRRTRDRGPCGRCCSVRGWRGRGFGWCCRCATRRWRRS